MLGLSDIRISICYCEHSLSAKSVIHNHPFSSSVLSQACMYTTAQCMRFQVHVSEKVSLIEHVSGKRKSYQSVGTWFDVFTTIKKIKQHLHTRNKYSSSIMENIFMQLEHYARGQMYQIQLETDVLDARTLTVSCEFQTRHTNLSGDKRHVYLPYSGIPVPGTHMMSNSHAVE